MTDTKDTNTQSLVMPEGGELMRHLEVRRIVASKTNPRKFFCKVKLTELAASIKATGVHQPLLVRPLPEWRVQEELALSRAEGREPAEYEIVAGERRWRASIQAELEYIPVMIREMTDAQALEAQVIENLQREDVTELEEAEGYEVLMKHQGINADQLKLKIGKSRAYVYARLKILDLCEEGKEALRTETIDFSRALLAARIPSKLLQLKAIAYMTEPQGWNDRLPSYRTCAEHVQQEYMLNLDKARFNITDASLVSKAGSCMLCSKRTGANPDLYEDIDSADVCTDRSCFESKTEAHTAQQVEAAQAKGQTVIFGQEAEDLAVHGYKEQMKGYRRLDSLEDSPHDQTLRKIIGAQMEADGILPVKIESSRKKGEFIEALPNETVLRLLKIVEGQAQSSEQVSEEIQAFAKNKQAKAAQKAKGQFEQAWRNQLRDRTWSAINSHIQADAFTTEVHRYLVLRTVHSLSATDAEAIAETLNLGKVGAHSALIQHAQETERPDFLQLLCMMQKDVSANDYSYRKEKNEGLMLVARTVFTSRLDTVMNEEKAIAADKYLSKIQPAPVKSVAPKPDLPLNPAARTSGGVGKGNAKKSKGLAAQAGGGRNQLTADEASARIAEAMQALGEPDQGADAQGNVAEPVAADAAQALPPSVTIRKSKLAKPSANTPAAVGTGGSVGDGQDSADVTTGAAVKKLLTPATRAVGLLVRVEPTVSKKQRVWIGEEGKVISLMGDRAVMVVFPAAPRCKPPQSSFDVSELEVIE